MMESQEVFGAGVGIMVFVIYLLFLLGMLIFTGLIAWKITAKTGYPGALGLIYFIPIANLVFLCILAFSEWPVHRELKSLKEIAGRQTGAVPPTAAGQ